MNEKELKKYYLTSFEEVLGLSLVLKDESSINVINLPEVIFKINPFTIKNLVSPIESILKQENLSSEILPNKTFYKKALITKYIYNLINNQAPIDTLDQFVDCLQTLSNKTYERKPTQMGFILFSDPKDNVKKELADLKIDFIPFSKPKRIDELDKEKDALKLVDSLSISYVVDNQYNVIGLAKKTKSNQSIASIMSSRYEKDDESILRFAMYRYLIKNNWDLKYKEKIEKLDRDIKVVQEKITSINLLINDEKNNYRLLVEKDAPSTVIKNHNKKLKELINDNMMKYQEYRDLQDEQISILKEELGKKNFLNHKLNNISVNKNLKVQRNIQYIQLNSGRIDWFINDSLICVLANGKWKVQNYELVSHLLLEYVLRQYTLNDKITDEGFIDIIDKTIPKTKILFNNIRELSNKNIGALIILLKQSRSQKKTIYSNLLSGGKLKDSSYKDIVKTKNLKPVNLFSCDNYLFELICSVDGAVLLDKYLNILSFAEMINNSIETPNVAEAGSRTLAAAKGSRYGLSIKVSEDGDISLFEDGSPIIKL